MLKYYNSSMIVILYIKQVCKDVVLELLDLMEQYNAENKSWSHQRMMQRIMSLKHMGSPRENFWATDEEENEEAQIAIVKCICEALCAIKVRMSRLVDEIEQGKIDNAEVSEDLCVY